MKTDTNDFNEARLRAVRGALLAIQTKAVGNSGENPVDGLDVLEQAHREHHADPTFLAGWLPEEAGLGPGLGDLFRVHADQIDETISGLKAAVIVRLFEGLDPAEAFRISMREFQETINAQKP
jgi:hypothetical protein